MVQMIHVLSWFTHIMDEHVLLLVDMGERTVFDIARALPATQRLVVGQMRLITPSCLLVLAQLAECAHVPMGCGHVVELALLFEAFRVVERAEGGCGDAAEECGHVPVRIPRMHQPALGITAVRTIRTRWDS